MCIRDRCGLRHVTYFYNFGTPFISLERTKLETSNLVCGLIVVPANQKCKSGSKGAWSTSRDLLFKFWDPLHISGKGAARDFKFGVRIHRLAYKPKSAKLGQKGSGLRHVTYFYNFGPPFISVERILLELSLIHISEPTRPY